MHHESWCGLTAHKLYSFQGSVISTSSMRHYVCSETYNKRSGGTTDPAAPVSPVAIARVVVFSISIPEPDSIGSSVVRTSVPRIAGPWLRSEFHTRNSVIITLDVGLPAPPATLLWLQHLPICAGQPDGIESSVVSSTLVPFYSKLHALNKCPSSTTLPWSPIVSLVQRGVAWWFDNSTCNLTTFIRFRFIYLQLMR